MGTRLECPHCFTVISGNPMGVCFSQGYHPQAAFADQDGYVGVEYQLCPSCNRYILHISDGRGNRNQIWPNTINLRPVNDRVPEKYARYYQRAEAILTISPEASAALTRRCLSDFLQEEANANERWTLEKQIEHAIGLTPPMFPPQLAKKLDYIRIVGKFAAHPKKNTNTGEVIDVEPEEAAYSLEVLGEVLWHHFIDPMRHVERAAAIDAKVASARHG